MSCNTSIILPGIKRLFFAVVEQDQDVDYIISNNDSIYLNTAYQFIEIDSFLSSNFKQKKVTDGKGVYYQKSFEFEFPDLMNDQLFEYLNKKLLIVFEDHSSRFWITGHESSTYKINKFEGTTGGDKNTIEITIDQNSYFPIQKFDLDSQPEFPIYSINAYINYSTIFDSILTGGTVVYWIKLNSSGTSETLLEKPNKFEFNINNLRRLNNTIYASGVTSGTSYINSTQLNIGEWYFVAHRIYRGFFPMTIQTMIYGDDGFIRYIDQDQLLSTNTIASSSRPFMIPISSNVEVKGLALYSRSLTYDGFLGIGEVLTLYNGGATSLMYANLSSYDPSIYDQLIAYYDFVDFSSNVIEDKHINNLNLVYTNN